jgi:hypothetical protein
MHHRWLVLGLCGAVARAASAAPDPARPVPEPAGDATVFPPEKVTTRPAAAAPASAGEPIDLDQLVIASSSRIDLNFFGDVSAAKFAHTPPGVTIGPLGFLVTAHLAEGLVGRTEFVLSFEQDSTVVDIERALIEYRTARWSIAAGRTNTELGYWNNAFHHGRWLQPTINRPRTVRFEDDGGILPINQVGVTVTHGPRRGEPGAEIALGVANGHGPAVTDIQTVGDKDLAKAVILRIGGVGFGDPSLHFGVSAAFDTIAPEPATVRPLLPDKQIIELVAGAYVALRADPWQVFAEAYDVMHRGGGRRWDLATGFVVVGYRIDKLTPYGQLEARRGDGLVDPFYNPDPGAEPEARPPENFAEAILGLKYDLSAWSAIKLELAGRRFQQRDVATGAIADQDEYRVEANWSFGR